MNFSGIKEFEDSLQGMEKELWVHLWHRHKMPVINNGRWTVIIKPENEGLLSGNIARRLKERILKELSIELVYTVEP